MAPSKLIIDLMFEVVRRSLASKRPSLKLNSVRSKLLSVGHWPIATATMKSQRFMHNQKAANQSCQRHPAAVQLFQTVLPSLKFQSYALLLPSYGVSAGTLSLTHRCHHFCSICSLVRRLDLPNSTHGCPRPKALQKHQPGLNRRFPEQGAGISRRDSWFDPMVPAKIHQAHNRFENRMGRQIV